MKILSKIFLIFILGGIMGLNMACNKRISGKTTFNGYVYDSLGGKPVSGAIVSLSACQFTDSRDYCTTFAYGGTVSDEHGYFTFGFFKEARSNNYFVRVNRAFPHISKDGVKTYEYLSGTTKEGLNSREFKTLYLK